MSENDMVISAVQIVNTSNNKSTYSNSSGEFTIEATANDELRFIKKGYERAIKKINNINESVNVILIRIPEEIEQVEILNLTGDLKRDSKKLTKEDKIEKLQKAIGLPKPPEIMREKAPELADIGYIGFPVIAINIDALYKVISGDSRRMKSLYRFDDLHRSIKWINERTDPQHFISVGIPKERINEFIEYAFVENPQSLEFTKKKNIDGTIFELEKTIPKFIERLKTTKNDTEELKKP